MIACTAIVLLTIVFNGCAIDPPPSASDPAAEGSTMLAPNAAPEQIERGKRIVQMQSVSCHAVRADHKSRNPNAPALRTLAEHYPVTGLEEAFALGIMTGHARMPDFRFGRDQIRDILAYLGSIQTRQGA
ncbi:MAG: cytochrome c [Hyphomonadaceae bacterium]